MRAGRSAAVVALPRGLYAPAVVGVLVLLLPLAALVGRIEWSTVPDAITSKVAGRALLLSVETAGAATVACLVLGIPLALLLARGTGRLLVALRTLVTLPMVLPPLIGGLALLSLLGAQGWGGRLLAVWGLRVPFTTIAVVIAQTFVALPFLVLALEGSLRTIGTGYERVGATLGAGRWTVFRRVTLPLVGPGLLSATVLCFARALGEFGATALFAGNRPGVTQTIPLMIYSNFNSVGPDQDSAIALALLLIVVAVVILLILRPRRAGAVR